MCTAWPPLATTLSTCFSISSSLNFTMQLAGTTPTSRFKNYFFLPFWTFKQLQAYHYKTCSGCSVRSSSLCRSPGSHRGCGRRCWQSRTALFHLLPLGLALLPQIQGLLPPPPPTWPCCRPCHAEQGAGGHRHRSLCRPRALLAAGSPQNPAKIFTQPQE